MRKSKFVGKEFDNNWVCTNCNLAANYCHGTRHNRYWYSFERRTSDNKFDKWIRIEATDATKIYKGELLVEDICNKRELNKRTGIKQDKHSVNYQFVKARR